MTCIKIIVICLLIYIICNKKKSECMTDMEKIQKSTEILNNKHLFNDSGKLSAARSKLPWLDSVSFYDSCILLNNNKNATISDLKNIFN